MKKIFFVLVFLCLVFCFDGNKTVTAARNFSGRFFDVGSTSVVAGRNFSGRFFDVGSTSVVTSQNSSGRFFDVGSTSFVTSQNFSRQSFDVGSTSFVAARNFSGQSFDVGSTSFVTSQNFSRQSFEIGRAPSVAPSVPSVFILVPESPFVERELWQNGTVTLSGEEISARIRGRGNSTWNMGENKRPLRIRFDEARSVFGSDYEARDWILLADNFDRSLMRNYAALNLARAMGRFHFTPSARHVHLYVNRQYMGVYLFTDERDVNAGRLELSPDDFFIELDGRANEPFVTVNHLNYRLRFPSGRALTPERADFAREFLEKVSRAIRFSDFEEILKLIDLDTFVDFYIVQEFFKNQDAYGFSVFMHISDEKLFMGPVWDFDIAAGNSAIQMMGSGAEGLYVAVFNYWYRNLMSRPEFFAAVATRWKELRDTEISQTIEEIKQTSARCQGHFERNFIRHPIPQNFLREEIRRISRFTGQVEFLVRWLEERAAWLDKFFAGELEYDAMWALVEYFGDSPVRVNVNGKPREFEIPPIRLPYAVKIAAPEIERLFDLKASVNSVGAINFSNDEIKISHAIGTNIFYVTRAKNSVAFESSAPSIKIREHNFIPLRIIAEIMGSQIEWNEEERLVVISIPSNI
jgi:hypothetical protein